VRVAYFNTSNCLRLATLQDDGRQFWDVIVVRGECICLELAYAYKYIMKCMNYTMKV